MRSFAVALALCAGLTCAQAQTFPYAAGHADRSVPAGRFDLTRPRGSSASGCAVRSDRPVVIENVGGAGGTIALQRVARAAPDGYTIDIGQWDTHVGAIIYPINFDLQKDFEPVGLMSLNPQLMIARKGFPGDDLKGLVSWMKANPGGATFVDQNAAAKLTGILMQQATGTTVQFIPYRGAGPAMQAMLGGQVDLMVVQAAVTLPQARAGTVKILANLSPQRSPVVPGVATSDESGIPGLYASGWFGLFAPRGTPKEIIARLNAAMVQALADPNVKRASRISAWTLRRLRSRHPKRSPRSRSARSRSGGRSSRPPTSRSNNQKWGRTPFSSRGPRRASSSP
jgi:tripartite-type tricarboxylate transporter receptor subunit TctC